ncbi:MAG: nucleotidyltransferase domain-containing protein [Candidatus Thermoplasmatota archaeon]|nr:nucleotidyltransferase domain-containing protein [Candidatus Thermoplasmatota archaeon]
MKLYGLLSSPERIRILEDMLINGPSLNKDVTYRTGVNKGLVSIYLNMLVDRGILTKSGRTYHVKDSAIVKATKRLLNLARISIDDIDVTWARGVGIYGSWAEGTNSFESDVDVWVIVDEIDNSRIALFRKILSDRTHAEVNILTLTDHKLNEMKERNSLFYSNLKCGSVVLAGENIG